MARDRANISIDIWSDADFRDLTPQAQALYFKLVSHPKLDYCGCVEFHPGRLAAMSREMTSGDVMVAAQELADKWFCVFDQTTDEVLVRSWVRHDGLMRQPRLAVSARQAAQSRLADAVIVYAEGLDAFEDEVQSIWEFHVPQYRRDRVPRWDLARISDWYRDRVPFSLIEYGLRVAIQAEVPWASKSAYAAAVVRNKIQEVERGENQDDQT